MGREEVRLDVRLLRRVHEHRGLRLLQPQGGEGQVRGPRRRVRLVVRLLLNAASSVDKFISRPLRVAPKAAKLGPLLLPPFRPFPFDGVENADWALGLWSCV